MPIQSGEYLISNVRERNIAFLGDTNAYSSLTGMARSRDCREDIGGKWYVTLLNNGRYTIQNVKHLSYASTKSGINLKPNETFVEGKRPDQSQPQQFILQEMSTPGQYIIGTTDSRLFWYLADREPGTPITLSNNFSNSRCWWTITSPSKTDLYCTITNGNYLLGYSGLENGSNLELQDEGDYHVQRRWIIKKYSPTRYFIQDLHTEYYAAPNSNHTMVILGCKKYAWNFKAHPTIQNRYWIYLHHKHGDLYWNTYIEPLDPYFEPDAGAIDISLGPLGDTLFGFRILNLNDPYDVDYSPGAMTTQELIGYLNSIHPSVQAEALDHVGSVITDPKMVTAELLEPLVRIAFFSYGPFKLAHRRINSDLRSIAPILWSALPLPMPEEALMQLLLLIERLAMDSSGQEKLTLPYRENSKETARLIDCLRSDGVEIARLACRILGTFTSFSKMEIEAIMRNMGVVLHHIDESDVDRTLEGLYLLKFLIMNMKKQEKELAIHSSVEHELHVLECSESAILWIPVRELMELRMLDPEKPFEDNNHNILFV